MSLFIELNDEIKEHYERVKRLAQEADDELSEDTLASRAQAMKVYSMLINNLLAMQKEAINLQRIDRIEQALMDAARNNFDEYQLKLFLEDVEERLRSIPS